MNRCADTTVFGQELGARLRALREQAGLTQTQVMILAGRTGKGAAVLASRLERGKVPYPSFGLVVDYLRGCRAGFAQLLDLLDPLTNRPPLEGRPASEVRRVAAALSPAARARVLSPELRSALASAATPPDQPVQPERPEERRRRVDLLMSAVYREQSLEPALGRMVDDHNWELGPAQRRWLVQTALGICRTYWRWPRRRHRRWRLRVERAQQACPERDIDPALVQVLGLELFEALEAMAVSPAHVESQTLARLATPSEKESHQHARRELRNEYERMCDYVSSQALMAAMETLRPLARDRFESQRWSSVASSVASLAVGTEHDQRGKQRLIAEYAKNTSRPRQVVKAGRAAIAAWERLKSVIPANPNRPKD